MKLFHLPILLTLTSATAFATPSGLNNIPTADTTPQGTFVLQTYTTTFGQADADLNIGFKTGIDFKYAHIELGADSHLLPDKGGPVTINGKLAVPIGERLPTLAIGAANATFRDEDRSRAGDEFFYGVATEDLGWFRVHGGCGLQDGSALPFYGLDKTFRYTKHEPASDGKAVVDSKSCKAVIAPKAIDLFTCVRMPSSNGIRAGSIRRACSCRSANTSCSRHGPISPTTAAVRLGRSKVISFSPFSHPSRLNRCKPLLMHVCACRSELLCFPLFRPAA